VTIWDPKIKTTYFENLLSNAEISTVARLCVAQGITPFVNVSASTIIQNHSAFYFSLVKLAHDAEKELVVEKYFSRTERLNWLPLDALTSLIVK